MRLTFRCLPSALGLLLAASFPAAADGARAAAAYFEARSAEERAAAMSELAALSPRDPQAAYVHAAGLFFAGVERLGQAFHRHGLDSPQSFVMPVLRMPVPENPLPEPLDYDTFRSILERFHADLSAAEAGFAAVPDDAEIAVDVDFSAFGLDLDADGRIDAHESLHAIVQGIAGPPARWRELQPVPDAGPALSFRFDRADGYWLQGYASFLLANVDFWLAHDFRRTFDQSFHMLFPRAGLPLQDVLVPREGEPAGLLASEWRIADFVSFVHLIDWEVVQPQRRRAARERLLDMIRLSRENWKAIKAETDNEREWLPGPHQPGPHPLTSLEVGTQEVQGWHDALAIAERLLDGTALLPHFRIAGKGLNMRRFFEEPQRFDLVLTITGPGATPWLEEGEIVTAGQWADVRRQFGRGNFMGFALWFN